MSVEWAKSLRKRMTDAEQRLWYRLRAHRFDGMKFKRQVPIGPYVVDFASLRAKLVIEVDGGQHGGRRDERRDRYLGDHGFRVLRFWNNDVLGSTDEVLNIVSDEVKTAAKAPSPGSSLRSEPPSPRWGEGN